MDHSKDNIWSQIVFEAKSAVQGEPYLKTFDYYKKSEKGLGLGIFIGKTLLEKNFASINFRNSETRGGAEVIIKWKNKELFNI